jgi:hypothetical protein
MPQQLRHTAQENRVDSTTPRSNSTTASASIRAIPKPTTTWVQSILSRAISTQPLSRFARPHALIPGYFEANRDLGLAIFQKFERGDGGEIAECLEKLEVAAQLVPQNPMIHYHSGQYLLL